MGRTPKRERAGKAMYTMAIREDKERQEKSHIAFIIVEIEEVYRLLFRYDSVGCEMVL